MPIAISAETGMLGTTEHFLAVHALLLLSRGIAQAVAASSDACFGGCSSLPLRPDAHTLHLQTTSFQTVVANVQANGDTKSSSVIDPMLVCF